MNKSEVLIDTLKKLERDIHNAMLYRKINKKTATDMSNTISCGLREAAIQKN